MSFDNICKFIAEAFSRDIAAWLLGTPIPLTKLEPSELLVEPIRADTVLFLESDDLLLHLEFQTNPAPDIGFRMADYRLRGYRRYPSKEMHQTVIYLRPTQSPLVHQTQFELPRTRHEFDVIRLWEQPTPQFLSSEGLLPFAALTQTTERTQTLRDVAHQIDQIENRRSQANLAAASAILAGLLLDQDIIHQILRRDIMRESVIYREIEAEAEARGETRGKLEGERNLVLRQIKRLLYSTDSNSVDSMNPDLEVKIQQLSLTELEQLGEDLLHFQTESDLIAWLNR